jgi:hypothetical protein
VVVVAVAEGFKDSAEREREECKDHDENNPLSSWASKRAPP